MVTRVYNKSDNFNVEIIKILHFSSDIHFQFFEILFLNGIKRVNRLIPDTSDKIIGIFRIYNKALNQCYPVHFLNNLQHDFMKKKLPKRTEAIFESSGGFFRPLEIEKKVILIFDFPMS